MRIIRFARSTELTSDEVLRRFCAKSFKTPDAVELVYLPFVLFRYTIDLVTLFNRKKSAEGVFLADKIQGIPINVKDNTK